MPATTEPTLGESVNVVCAMSSDVSPYAVRTNDVPFNTGFPYVAYPHSGSDADPH